MSIIYLSAYLLTRCSHKTVGTWKLNRLAKPTHNCSLHHNQQESGFSLGAWTQDLNTVPHSGHYMYRTVVTICTAQWSLYVPHSGHYMYRTVVTICTAQWSLYVPYSGHYMYRTVVTICTARFNICRFYVLPTQCIYVFCVDLRTNSDYFPIQH